MTYLEFQFNIEPFKPWSEILTAYLSEIEFQGFFEQEGVLKAFIPEELFNESEFQSILENLRENDLKIEYLKQIIPKQNWNASWESNFNPVEINKELRLIAPFHDKNDTFRLTLIIQPKMSFGTGHHQTTHMMCEAILKLNLKDKKVLDMGAGTGVLSILCEKLGSTDILAIDIEEWSVENCIENAETNNCSNISSICGDVDLIIGKKFDYIFANINKNILKSHMITYFESLSKNGFLYLSGFFNTDIDELKLLAESVGLLLISTRLKDEWAMLVLQK